MKGRFFSIGAFFAVVSLSTPVYAEGGGDDSICPKHSHQRTAAQVLQAHLTAFQAGNAELVGCDYATDAVFTMPGAVARGRENIEAIFAPFLAVAGGNIHVATHSLTIAADVALFEYSVDSDHVVVSDGTDTFVIDNGLIVAHTARLGGLSLK
jgi:uncharacterized protein (TIGR02246 family)